MKEEEGCG